MPDESSGTYRRIAADSFTARQIEEQRNCFFLAVKIMGEFLSVRSDPPPAAAQADFSKQCLLNGKRIKSGHVLSPVGALDVNPVGLRDHDRDSRIVNRRSNETFESVTRHRFIFVMSSVGHLPPCSLWWFCDELRSYAYLLKFWKR